MARGKGKSGGYVPPFTVGARAMNMLAEIARAAEHYRILLEGPDGLMLRKANHIRTIHGSTAIEGNSLTEEEITALLDGKRVAAPQREIDEVMNAHDAYSIVEGVDPYNPKELLRIHGIMAKNLVPDAGRFRSRQVGVVDGLGHVVHMAPPFQNVPALVGELFDWVRRAEEPVLIKSCVFHYEFEFIHPFIDGNGRMGRFWQTALLGKWNSVFYSVPVESIVWANQQAYYRAIQASTAIADSSPFIEFMLEKILSTLKTKGEAKERELAEKKRKEEEFAALEGKENKGKPNKNKASGAAGAKKRGKRTEGKELREKKELSLLAMLLANKPDITQVQIAEAMHVSQASVERYIKILKEEKKLKRIGGRKIGRWEVL